MHRCINRIRRTVKPTTKDIFSPSLYYKCAARGLCAYLVLAMLYGVSLLTVMQPDGATQIAKHVHPADTAKAGTIKIAMRDE